MTPAEAGAGLSLDHVALVVADLERALRRARELAPDLPCGPIEEFPAEGTREVYLGADGARARLLLLQPLGEAGPYARALARRGPGLHHVCAVAPALEAALAALPGWAVVPRSPVADGRGRTRWLHRPGVATLLELTRGDAPAGPPVVTSLAVPCPAELTALLAPLGLSAAGPGEARLTLAGRVQSVSALVA